MARFMRSEKGTEQKNSERIENTANGGSTAIQNHEPEKRSDYGTEPSIISASLKVTGNLESDAEIRLDGKVEGDVRAKVITIGESASLIGSLRGETVTVAGKVEGKIEGRSVIVAKTAHITGDIIHESLQIEAGAYVDGHCRPQFGKSEIKRESPKPTAPTQPPNIQAPEKPSDATGSDKPAAI